MRAPVNKPSQYWVAFVTGARPLLWDGRYVSDIFYHPTIDKKEEVYDKGLFLNQELLAAGLADRMD